MAIAKVVMRLPWNEPAIGPASTNIWNFDTGVLSIAAAALVIAPRIADFYTNVTYFGSLLSGVGEMSIYDAEEAAPAEAIYTATTGFDPAADTLPPEIALMLSAAATQPTGESRKRGHWRTRIGPLRKSALGNDGRFTDDVVDEVWAAQGSLTTALGGDDIVLVAGSRAFGFEEVSSARCTNAPYLVSKRDLPATYSLTLP